MKQRSVFQTFDTEKPRRRLPRPGGGAALATFAAHIWPPSEWLVGFAYWSVPW